jgi:hypothetical protein
MSNETTVENNDEDIDLLLSGYNKQLTEEPETEEVETDEESEQENTTSQTPPSGQSVEWRGNPNYFQTGKKAGQLKKQAQHHAPPKQEMEISGTLIDGALFIMLIDLLFPMLITLANNNLSATKIDVEDLQLSTKQKNDLQPIADQVVKYLTLKANPVWLLTIAMAGIYGINTMAARQVASAKIKDKEKK